MSVTSSILSETISENDPETDSPVEGEQDKETTSTEAENLLQQGFLQNGKDDAKSDSSESASASDESSDEEKVFDEKLYYEADSEDERLALQSLDTSGSEATCSHDRNAFRELSSKYDGDDNCAQVLVVDLLQNSLQESITQENGHLNESSDAADIMKMNILPGTKLNDCTQYPTKSKNNHFESWKLTDWIFPRSGLQWTANEMTLRDNEDDKSTWCLLNILPWIIL